MENKVYDACIRLVRRPTIKRRQVCLEGLAAQATVGSQSVEPSSIIKGRGEPTASSTNPNTQLNTANMHLANKLLVFRIEVQRVLTVVLGIALQAALIGEMYAGK